MITTKYPVLFLMLVWGLAAAEPRAKNVILFIGDAGGIPTLTTAGIRAYDKPQSLYLHTFKHIALSDTSSRDRWVTDSAAGMTAIVTGQKTNNGMLSLLPAENGAAEQPLKTILEYAEERGLSTGVVTNMAIWDATPGACYSHVASRKSTAEIFKQALNPRFGDGVDILVGVEKGLMAAAQKDGWDVMQGLRAANYQIYASPDEIPADAGRAVSIYQGGDFEPGPVVRKIMQSLARNPKGFFLMVEWDMHTEKTILGLDRAIVMDNLIRQVAEEAPADTLIVYAADHSFDFRLRGGRKGEPMAAQIDAQIAAPTPPEKPVFKVENSHSGEDILVAAQGPGAERLGGFIPNTQIFHVMMDAYGWTDN